MDFMSKFTISASMLLTGFAIVFAVLFFLIFIIWGYGRLVSGAQHKYTERKNKKELEKIPAENLAAPETAQSVQPDESVPDAAEEGISEEVIAVISAAVYSLYGSKDKVRIKSVKRSKRRSAWAKAGVLDNTRPF